MCQLHGPFRLRSIRSGRHVRLVWRSRPYCKSGPLQKFLIFDLIEEKQRPACILTLHRSAGRPGPQQLRAQLQASDSSLCAYLRCCGPTNIIWMFRDSLVPARSAFKTPRGSNSEGANATRHTRDGRVYRLSFFRCRSMRFPVLV